MTACPPPAVSRLDVVEEDEDLLQESSVKKNLQSAFDTPVVVKKRISRLSQNFQQLPVEYMKVFLRLRPFTEKELKENEDQRTMRISDDRHVLTAMAPKDSKTFKTSSRGIGEPVRHFTFTKIFDQATSQKEFYRETSHPLVQDFIDGNNALIFTYGVTNAGKTYTLQGSQGNEGIIPQAIDVLFNNVGDKIMKDVKFKPKMAHNLRFLTEEEQVSQNKIKEEVLSMAAESRASFGQDSLESSAATEMTDTSAEETLLSTSRYPSMEGSSTIPSEQIHGPVKYAIFVSFVEVYRELTYDLLTAYPKEKKQTRPVLVISDDGKGASYVKGMREIQVNSPEEVMKILEVGQRNLHVAATNLNKDSSRSHCIFTITLVQVMDIPDPTGGRVSKISFCDLAGSERANKTKEVGDRLKEAGKINTSLMKLGMCIEALRHNQQYKDDKQKQRAVSFRDSKLTRLFRSYLLGEGRACMIVNANMCASGFDETAHVLKFSAIAKEVQIINKPKPKIKSRATLFEEKFESAMEAVKRPRNTIAWERKLTPVKDLNENPEEEEEEEEDEIYEESEDYESDSEDEDNKEERDVAYWKNREKKFIELIEMMKKAVSQEQKNSKKREAEIRRHVVQQMQNQIVQIENSHEEQIEDTISLLQVEQEKRLGIVKDVVTEDIRKLKERLDKKYWDVVTKNTNMEQELAECKEQLKSKTTELQSVEDKVTATDLQINMLQMDLEKKEKEIVTLKNRHRRSSSRYSSMDKEQFILDLEKENEEGRFLIKQLMEEVDEHRSKVEEEQEENNKLNESLKAANKKIEQLLSQDQESKGSDIDTGELERLKKEHQSLQEKMVILEEKSVQLCTKLELRNESAAEDNVLGNTEYLLKHLPEWMDSNQETISHLTSEVESEKSEKLQIKSLHDELAQKVVEQDEYVKQIEQIKADFTKQKEQIEVVHCEEMQKTENERKMAKDEFQSKIESLKEKLNKAESDLSAYSDAKKKITELENESLESKKFEQQLMKETDRLHAEVKKLKKENSEVKQNSMKRTSDASELKQDVAILTQDRNDLLTRVEDLQKHLADTKKEKQTLEEELRENLANTTTVQLNTELSVLKNTVAEKEASIQRLDSEKHELSTKFTSLEEEMASFQRKVDDTQKGMKMENEKLQREIEDVKKSKSKLELDLEERGNQSDKLQQNVDNLRTEHDNMTNELNDLKKILDEKEKEKKSIENVNKNIQEELKKTNSESDKLSKECKQFQKNITLLEQKVKKLETERETNSKSKTDTEESNTKLTEQVKEKQSELNNLEKDFEVYKMNSDEEIKKLKQEFESQMKKEKDFYERELKQHEKQDSKTKSAAEETNAKLTEELENKQDQFHKLEKEFENFKKKSGQEMEAMKKKLQNEISSDKATHKKELKQLETKLTKAIESKDKELTQFRENRDRIVAALEVQIKNDKSTNELLKANLDEQMAEVVQLKSQNAAVLAQSTDLKKQLEKKSANSRKQSLNKSASTSAVVNTDSIVAVKREPMSPQHQEQVVSAMKRRADTLSPVKGSSGGESHSGASEAEVTVPTRTSAGSRKNSSTRGRKRGGSNVGTRASSRKTKRVTGRPATPLPEAVPAEDDDDDDNDDDWAASSSKKKRQTTRKTNIKAEAVEEQGVLDDSELMRETGNSRNFPQPTMELDVTPQVKKTKKARKRGGTKKDDQEHDSPATREESPFSKRFKFFEKFISNDEDAGPGTLKTGRSLRAKTRGTNNANNSNNSKTSDEDTASVLSLTASKNLTKVGDMLKNSPVAQALKAAKDAIGPATKSPKKAKKQPEEQQKKSRRMVKLHPEDISLPLEATPSPEHIRDMATSHGVGETPARMMRRLRNRR
uniref:kinesin-like protein KIF20B isoform X1 n=1 Tax=Styela clava TaxID=7725 RepID=UPI001939B508|nr:kinesin-like protein KIF20B isoform X1 [Styela clava]